MQHRFGQISERRLGGNTRAYVSTLHTGLVPGGVLSQAPVLSVRPCQIRWLMQPERSVLEEEERSSRRDESCMLMGIATDTKHVQTYLAGRLRLFETNDDVVLSTLAHHSSPALLFVVWEGRQNLWGTRNLRTRTQEEDTKAVEVVTAQLRAL